MIRRSWWLILAIPVVGWVIYSSFQAGQEDYEGVIIAKRKERERQIRNELGSTLPASYAFHYYDVDPALRVSAKIEEGSGDLLTLSTNDGQTRRFKVFGYAKFSLNDTACTLTILESLEFGPSRGTLFLAFGDGTSAMETYGGGRYLDVSKPKGRQVLTLDFNLAYNPYCAYADSFSCPFPPRENLLPVSIRAGEKLAPN